jgi:hypothetical protein
MKSTLISRLKQLERAECVRQRQADTAGQEAFVVFGCFDGERHLEMTSSDAGRCWFQERPGPGPQLADFGPFASILYLTPAEAEA